MPSAPCAALLMVGCVTQALAQGLVLEVIPLKHRTVEQVIPVLRPLVPREGSVSGFQNQLVVRATPASLAEIKRVLASIDGPLRRLVITVRHDTHVDTRRRDLQISGTLGTGRNDYLGARVQDTRSLESERNTQTVQVVEGGSALIQTGRSIAVPRQRIVHGVVGGRSVERVVEDVEYRDVMSGFHVRPRLAGEVVTLEITPQHDTPDRQDPGAVNLQRVSTTVSGRLGEWIEIGGTGATRADENSVMLGSTVRAGSDTRRVLIKVEEAKELVAP